jgi:inner membrane protein
MCSFTDVNLFEKPEYIVACAVFSVLPDIDTTKSAIGKICYPVSWLLYRKFGHRTITHSFLFLFFIWALFYALFRFEVIPNTDLVKIAVFSTIGHFVFDMITVSAIPLFYPFYKSRCVVPANPNYRFKSGDWKSEMIVMGICGLLVFTMQPLFAHGFWTAYNRQFGTIKHVDRENRNTEYYVVCEYSYILNAEAIEGEAIVIDSKQNELILFDRRKVFALNSDNPQLKVIHTRPRVSTIEKRFEDLKFFNVGYDSLQMMLNGKLASGLIQSNTNVRYIEDAITYYTNFIKFSNRFDFQIYAGVDTTRTTIRRNMARLEASIEQSRQRHQSDMQKWKDYQNGIRSVEDSLKSKNLSNYERNKLQQELMRLRNRNPEQPTYTPPAVQIAELNQLRQSLTESNLLFSGHLTVYNFGYDQSRTNPNVTINPINIPCYTGSSLLASSNSSNSLNSLNQ